ncbi:MAG: hypothetical protein HC871_10540 [Rhizobiales bacterium]|nr:hypothetical protein [Hyphomicrobiales bacterium]
MAATTEPTGAGAGNAASSTGTQEAALAPSADLRIQVSVENSQESGPPVAFNVQLSRPSETSVVLIYATIDGTAVNGQDYEANRGVVVLKPGEQVARIEAPVIDDADQEEQEHLQLFLTVDPAVATVESRQIVATIDDDDSELTTPPDSSSARPAADPSAASCEAAHPYYNSDMQPLGRMT